MFALFCVGIGGFLGAIARYLLWLVPVEGDLPLMTFLTNFIGAVAIGAITEIGPDLPAEARLFFATGLCGGFTTFSTFSLETLRLLESGKYLTGTLYAGGSLVACVLGVAVGKLIVRGALAVARSFAS